jgi:Tn3 transposase DDE domain
LVVNVMSLWKAIDMNAAIEPLKAEGYRVREEDAVPLSPLSHEHIDRPARYAFTWPEPVASGGLRPLRYPNHLWKMPRDRRSGCPSRKLEALHPFDFFRFPPHAGSVDSFIFRHTMMRRFLIMLPVISALLAFVAALFRSRASLSLEHLALRHQLAVYQQTVDRPRLRWTDRVLWAWLSNLVIIPFPPVGNEADLTGRRDT